MTWDKLTDQLYSIADDASKSLEAAGAVLGMRLPAAIPGAAFVQFGRVKPPPPQSRWARMLVRIEVRFAKSCR